MVLASGGVLLLSSPCFLYMQQARTRRRGIICLTFTFRHTHHLWRHSFARDSRFLEMPPFSMSLPSCPSHRSQTAVQQSREHSMNYTEISGFIWHAMECQIARNHLNLPSQ